MMLLGVVSSVAVLHEQEHHYGKYRSHAYGKAENYKELTRGDIHFVCSAANIPKTKTSVPKDSKKLIKVTPALVQHLSLVKRSSARRQSTMITTASPKHATKRSNLPLGCADVAIANPVRRETEIKTTSTG